MTAPVDIRKLAFHLGAFALAVCMMLSCQPNAIAQTIPSGLAPGMYYYFRDGDDRPTVHYVPGTGAGGDPFSKPVKPLPIPGQENFPLVPFSALQEVSLADFEPYIRQREQNRAPVQSGQWSAPAYQPPPGMVQQHQENLLDAVEKGQTPPMFQQPQSPGAYSPYQQPQPLYPQSPPYMQQPAARPPGMTSMAMPQSNTSPYSGPSNPQGWQQRPAPQQPGRPVNTGMVPQQRPMQQAGPPGMAAQMPVNPAANPFQQSGVTSTAITAPRPVRGMSLQEVEQVSDITTRAVKYLQQKKWKEAVPLLEKAVTFDPNPNSAKLHSNLAVAYTNLGSYDQALNQYNVALRYDPQLVSVYAGIGGVYQVMGKVPEAKAAYQKYLQVNPTAHDAEEVKGFIAAMNKAQGKMPTDDPNGLDYYQSVVQGEPLVWPADVMPIKVFISTGDGVTGFKKQFHGYATDALNAWSEASGRKLSWIPVMDTNAADVTVDWFSSAAGLPKSTGAEGGTCQPTCAVLPNGREILKKCKVCIVLFHPDGRPTNDAELKKICMHEFGHCLGLYGHSSNNTDIMFFSEAPTVSALPTSRDRATLTRLYADHPVCGR